MEYINSRESMDYVPRATSLISRFNKLAANMTNNDELEKKEKELKSRLEVADSIEERKRLRLELKEVRQKLFSPKQKVISKETNRILPQDVNNNVIPTDVKTKQPDISQGLKTNKVLNKPDENNNQSSSSPGSLPKSDASSPHTDNPVKITKKDTQEEKRENAQVPSLNDGESNSNNNINNKTLTKGVSKETTQEVSKPTEDKKDNMSITIKTSSRFAKNTDTNNNEEGVNGYCPAERQVSPAERAARRAKRAERMNVRVDTPDESVCATNQVSSMCINDDKPEEKTGGLRRTATWSPQKSASSAASKFGSTAAPGKFQFGVDYTKKTCEPVSKPLPGRIATNKYTPTVTPNRPKSAAFTPTNRIGGSSNNTGRFQGIQRDEPEKPSFGGSAQDRMAHFRQAMEKEKEQKAKEEERKHRAEERKKEDEEKKKLAEEQKKQDEIKKKEEEEKRLAEEKANPNPALDEDIPDSEKIKHIAPCKKKREKKPARRTMSISNIVLDWCQEMTKDYPVEIKNFSTSWNNGMAFCALIHKFNPDEFDFACLCPENKRDNFDLAFKTGEKVKNIPILLDTEDMVRMKKPEPRSVQTYIQWIWSVYGPTSGYGPTPQEVQQATLN